MAVTSAPRATQPRIGTRKFQGKVQYDNDEGMSPVKRRRVSKYGNTATCSASQYFNRGLGYGPAGNPDAPPQNVVRGTRGRLVGVWGNRLLCQWRYLCCSWHWQFMLRHWTNWPVRMKLVRVAGQYQDEVGRSNRTISMKLVGVSGQWAWIWRE